MRTTVDLPDDLYRQAKSQAALEGVRLRDLIEEGLRRVLGTPSKPKSARRVAFPLHHSRNLGALSISEVTEAEATADQHEDLERARTL